jgi:hypothetical protein
MGNQVTDNHGFQRLAAIIEQMRAEMKTQLSCLGSRVDSHHEELKQLIAANLNI